MRATCHTIAAILLTSTPLAAEPVTYALDPSHSQVLFSFDHLGFSTTYGLFSGIEGTIVFDAEAPEASRVEAAFPLRSMFTGWDARDAEFLSPDFLDAEEGTMVTFTSTGIEVTGEDAARITGTLAIGDLSREVVLDTVLKQRSRHPIEMRPWLGLSATTTILRSDFGAGAFAPAISDELDVTISIEAGVPPDG